MFNKKGFTMIELLIVIIIVAVLASVAIPMMTANVERAKKSEAVAALGAIRSAERIIMAEGTAYVAAADIKTLSGINAGDLNGTYFSEDCYAVAIGGGGTTFTATCTPASSLVAKSPLAGEVTGYTTVITINEGGVIAGN